MAPLDGLPRASRVALELAEKRIVVTLVAGTRKAIDAVRGKQSMTEFCREAIAREIERLCRADFSEIFFSDRLTGSGGTAALASRRPVNRLHGPSRRLDRNPAAQQSPVGRSPAGTV
jgi:hypothetical protein